MAEAYHIVFVLGDVEGKPNYQVFNILLNLRFRGLILSTPCINLSLVIILTLP